jgi:WD40 repeat protein
MTAKLWDVTACTLLATLHGPDNTIQSVVFNPDGITLASGRMRNGSILDPTIKLWDISGIKSAAK